VLNGSIFAYYGYIGFEMMSTMTEESLVPKDIPKSMLCTVLICIIIYSVNSYVFTGLGISEISQTNNADIAIALCFQNI
jgi:amino acid transporter